MGKAKTTTIGHQLIIATIFAAALSCLDAQIQSPAPAPAPYMMSAPSPSLDCLTYLINLSDCLSFVESGSKLSKPDPGCCPELANLVDTQPICLCQLLGNATQLGISVDVNRALKLPSACNVTTPPVTLCAAIGVPVGAFAPSDAPSDSDVAGASPSPGNRDINGSPTNNIAAASASGHHHFLFLIMLMLLGLAASPFFHIT